MNHFKILTNLLNKKNNRSDKLFANDEKAHFDVKTSKMNVNRI